MGRKMQPQLQKGNEKRGKRKEERGMRKEGRANHPNCWLPPFSFCLSPFSFLIPSPHLSTSPLPHRPCITSSGLGVINY